MNSFHPVCRALALAVTSVLAAQTQGEQGVKVEKVDVGVHQAGTAPSAPQSQGNPWFEKVRLDLGTFLGDERATGKFTFKNPTAAEQKFTNVVGSCACTRAIFKLGDRVYSLDREPAANSLHRIEKKDGQEVKERVSHITINPGEVGEVEVQMDMHGVRGPKEANMSIQTSDPGTPQVQLVWSAVGAIYFEVNPPEVHFNEMTWNDKREFQFEISSPLREDFNITGHDELPKGVALTSEKTSRNGRAVWVVKGSFGPGVDERQNGAVLNFHTDLDNKRVEARLVAFVKGPLTVEPGGFVSLGFVPLNETKFKTIKITPSDNFDLKADKLEFEDLQVPAEAKDKLVVESEKDKDGKSLLIKLTVMSGMPRTTIRGKLKVHLNHPMAPIKEFLFNGFVR